MEESIALRILAFSMDSAQTEARRCQRFTARPLAGWGIARCGSGRCRRWWLIVISEAKPQLRQRTNERRPSAVSICSPIRHPRHRAHVIILAPSPPRGQNGTNHLRKSRSDPPVGAAQRPLTGNLRPPEFCLSPCSCRVELVDPYRPDPWFWSVGP